MRKRIRAVIRGSVQGVGFRWFVLRSAEKNNIVGWVRNNRDGSVETVAEGEISSIDDFINDLRRGPIAAYVSSIEIEQQTLKGEFDSFQIVF